MAANLRRTCEFIVYNELHTILTHLSFLVEIIKKHVIDKDVSMLRKT